MIRNAKTMIKNGNLCLRTIKNAKTTMNAKERYAIFVIKNANSIIKNILDLETS